MKFLRHRIADERVLRLVTRWLNAGVTEDGAWSDSGEGTMQGGLCIAEHNPPNAQCWIMRSAGALSLVRVVWSGER